MNNSSKWREVMLLAIPILALIAWCLWLQFRQPFKLTVDEISVALIPPNKAFGVDHGERQVAVEIFLDHEGWPPSWWGQQVGLWRPRVHFVAKGKQDDNSNVGSYAGPKYDETRGQYRILYNGWIPDSPNYLKSATCHVSVGLANTKFPTKPLAMTEKTSIPAAQFKVPIEAQTTMPDPPY